MCSLVSVRGGGVKLGWHRRGGGMVLVLLVGRAATLKPGSRLPETETTAAAGLNLRPLRRRISDREPSGLRWDQRPEVSSDPVQFCPLLADGGNLADGTRSRLRRRTFREPRRRSEEAQKKTCRRNTATANMDESRFAKHTGRPDDVQSARTRSEPSLNQ